MRASSGWFTYLLTSCIEYDCAAKNIDNKIQIVPIIAEAPPFNINIIPMSNIAEHNTIILNSYFNYSFLINCP